MESLEREKYVIFGLVGKIIIVLKPSDLTELIGNQLELEPPTQVVVISDN